MVKTTSHKDDLTMALDNGTALFNYVPPYIVTEKKNIYLETSASRTNYEKKTSQ